MRTGNFAHPIVEQTVWVQTQAPAGNWVDRTGFPYGDGEAAMQEAIQRAQQSAAWEEQQGTTTRIVRKVIEVLVLDSPEASDRWIPGCGGTEVPFHTRTGRRLLYCWNPGTGQHAYIDVATDIVLTNEEAQQALGY
jgi:hypothetical protein